MAMEYIYIGENDVKQPVALKNFRDLRYTCEDYFLEIIDEFYHRKAFFNVKPQTCYVLQRRNKSAFQLHEVKNPRPRKGSSNLNVLVWMFGFGNKQYCESREDLTQSCCKYQAEHPQHEVIVKDVDSYGAYLTYAYAVSTESPFVNPVAYCYELPQDDVAWALCGKDFKYEVVEQMCTVLEFKYPLQFMIRIFKSATTSYPTEAKEFFQRRLGRFDSDVYYADDPELGF